MAATSLSGPNGALLGTYLRGRANWTEGTDPHKKLTFAGLRPDIRSFPGAFILALEGRLDVLTTHLESLRDFRIGGRSLAHFFALGGHFEVAQAALEKAGYPMLPDEYEGTPAKIHAMVCARDHVPLMAGDEVIPGRYSLTVPYVPAEKLLKLWMLRVPKRSFLEVKPLIEAVDGRLDLSRACPEKVAVERAKDPRLGLQLRAIAPIKQGELIDGYFGAIDEDLWAEITKTFTDGEDAEFPVIEGYVAGDSCDGVMDGATYLSKAVLANDGPPNAKLQVGYAVEGLVGLTGLVALKDIAPGESVTTLYQRHDLRTDAQYIEIVPETRKAVFDEIISKRKSSDLTKYHKAVLDWFFLTPQLGLRLLRNRELSFKRFERLLYWQKQTPQLESLMDLACEPIMEMREQQLDVVTRLNRLGKTEQAHFVEYWLGGVLDWAETLRTKEHTICSASLAGVMSDMYCLLKEILDKNPALFLSLKCEIDEGGAVRPAMKG